MNEWHLARGYRFAGIVSGLRTEPDRRDLAVVVSDTPAAAAGVFTQNRVCAAPVQVSRARLPRPDARAFVVCSGNANACTGEQGLADARRMAELVAVRTRLRAGAGAGRVHRRDRPAAADAGAGGRHPEGHPRSGRGA